MALLLPLLLVAVLLLVDPPGGPVRERVENPPPPPTTGPTRTLSELKDDYDSKSAEYKQLLDQAVSSGDASSIERIRRLNVELSNLLEQMIATVSPTQPKASIEATRDQLVERLRRIQMDYNGLLQTTDELETLRRIRAQEQGGFLQVFYWHLVALACVFVGVVIAMVYMRRATSPATTPSPTIRADLA